MQIASYFQVVCVGIWERRGEVSKPFCAPSAGPPIKPHATVARGCRFFVTIEILKRVKYVKVFFVSPRAHKEEEDAVVIGTPSDDRKSRAGKEWGRIGEKVRLLCFCCCCAKTIPPKISHHSLQEESGSQPGPVVRENRASGWWGDKDGMQE